MAAIVWDAPSERIYEYGVDRGVIYPPEGNGFAWNGIISVVEKAPTNEGSPIYYDGVKYADSVGLGDYAATLKAYTYPDEFLPYEGIQEAENGLFITSQVPKRFGFSYRTKIGNDTEGADLGYKIHIVYNATAYPAQKNFETSLGDDAIEFEWSLTAIPEEAAGYRPTAHIIFDTRYMGPLVLEDLEDTIYGDEITDPSLPPLQTFIDFISDWVIIRITDNYDGTWTAEGPDEYFSMISPTEFQIIQANAVYLDSVTYDISDLTY